MTSHPFFHVAPSFPVEALANRWRVSSFAAVRVLICLWLTQFIGFAQTSNASPASVLIPAFRPDRILIQPKAGLSPVVLANFHSALKVEVLRTFEGIGHLQVLRVPDKQTAPGLITRYQQSGLVEFAESDYMGHVFTTPNDPDFSNGSQWALNNFGRNTEGHLL